MHVTYRICDQLSMRKKKMFFGPLIENTMSKLKNSKRRIQNIYDLNFAILTPDFEFSNSDFRIVISDPKNTHAANFVSIVRKLQN